MKTIEEIREFSRQFSGFTGGWSVTLDGWQETYNTVGQLMAYGKPQHAKRHDQEENPLVTFVPLQGGLELPIIYDWDRLVRQVRQDALRERLLVAITGNLSCADWEKAIAFSGRQDGKVRRAVAGVPVGAPYWVPTREQLDSV